MNHECHQKMVFSLILCLLVIPQSKPFSPTVIHVCPVHANDVRNIRSPGTSILQTTPHGHGHGHEHGNSPRSSIQLNANINEDHNFREIHDTEEETIIEYDDSEAESQFGTKEYWDDMYVGRGDFEAEEYSWYFGFGTLKPFFDEYMPPPPQKSESVTTMPKMLIPGVGNDGTLLDLYHYGYHDIVAFDYSQSAIDRQEDLLSYDSRACEDVTLLVGDARRLDEEWGGRFDVIFEKGALDAVFLSGGGNVEKAVEEMKRVIKPGGYFMSVSGVVPEALRRDMFDKEDWTWIRDGSDDLKAGCFVWRRRS